VLLRLGTMPGYYGYVRGHDTGRYRATIQEAAKRLGVKETAIRKRIERGTLEKEKGEDGRVYVFIDVPPTQERDTSNDTDYDASHPAGYDALISELRDRVEFLQRELERKDAILLNMTEAMNALSPPAHEEPPESPTPPPEYPEPRPATGGPQNGYGQPRDTAEFPVRGSLTRPWWRRVFGR
jgi:hypothetical protein